MARQTSNQAEEDRLFKHIEDFQFFYEKSQSAVLLMRSILMSRGRKFQREIFHLNPSGTRLFFPWGTPQKWFSKTEHFFDLTTVEKRTAWEEFLKAMDFRSPRVEADFTLLSDLRGSQSPLAHLIGTRHCHATLTSESFDRNLRAHWSRLEVLDTTAWVRAADRDQMIQSMWNKQFCTRCIEELTKQKCKAVMMFFDIDDFKAKNSLYGRGSCDVPLIHIGNVIASHFREGDVAVHWGGDEYAVIMPVTSSMDMTIKLAQQKREEILNLLSRPFKLRLEDGTIVRDIFWTSAGIVPISGRRGLEVTEIYDLCSQAADRDKARRKALRAKRSKKIA
jgi:diguanylate cyclase (GGDEF)-like protein